jgi:hypothetical protein
LYRKKLLTCQHLTETATRNCANPPESTIDLGLLAVDILRWVCFLKIKMAVGWLLVNSCAIGSRENDGGFVFISAPRLTPMVLQLLVSKKKP